MGKAVSWIVGVTGFALLCSASCIVKAKTLEFLDDVEIKVDRVGVQSLALTGATLTIHTQVINHSDVNFAFKGMDYEIYYQGRLIGSGHDEKYRTIGPRCENTFEFAVNASYADTVSTFLNLGRDDVCLVKGRATTISVVGKAPVDFSVEARFGPE